VNDFQSKFVSRGCSYHWFNTKEACQISAKFAGVFVHGDSLSRHVTQGLFMHFTGDLVSGGLPRTSPKTVLYDSCICDGQFSENKVCRDYSLSMFNVANIRSYGACSNINHGQNKRANPLFNTFKFYYNSDPQKTCFNDTRPRFIVLQGGVHFDSSAKVTMEKHVDIMVTSLTKIQQTCLFKYALHFVFMGYDAQSRKLDKAYPNQSRENATLFNSEMEVLISDRFPKSKGFNITFLNFWNMTRDSQSSDGFHYLSDVNLVKAMVLFNHMDLIVL
jgi:hypothetical protein